MNYDNNMGSNIYDKPDMTIIVTDSGLGGISVAAELYAKLKERPQSENVRIIYFNALFHEDSGYTFLERSQQIEMFNAALQGMLNYSPDLILIACNTLSLMYPETPLAQSAALPVIGIVEIGVNYLLKKALSEKDAAVMLFATPVTIKEGTHKRILRQFLPEHSIIEQACPELAFAIGDGETSKIKQLIDKYVTRGIQKMTLKPSNIYGSLNCTHFGYYQDEFLQAFEKKGVNNIEILNPNSEMVNFLFSDQKDRARGRNNIPKSYFGNGAQRNSRNGGSFRFREFRRRIPATTPWQKWGSYADTDPKTVSRPFVGIKFVSKAKINANGMKSLLPLLQPISMEVAQAFQNYCYDPNLF